MYRKINIVIIGIMIITLSGCNNTLKNRGTTDIDNPIKIVDEEQPIVKNEQLVMFDELLNNKENIGFILSTYKAVTEVNFKDLLLEFPLSYSNLLDNTSDEYNQLVSFDNNFKDKEIYKIKTSNLKNYLKDKTGFTYQEFSYNSLNELIYLKEYDSYYTYSKFDEKLVVDTISVTNESNIYNILYKNKLDNKKYKLKLAQVDDKYLFVSNITE